MAFTVSASVFIEIRQSDALIRTHQIKPLGVQPIKRSFQHAGLQRVDEVIDLECSG